MNRIIISNPKNDSLVSQLLSLYETFKGKPSKDDLEFDLSKIDWFYPLLILPLSAYINDTQSKYATSNLNNSNSYLDTVKFPEGIDSISSFQQQVQKGKSYIPISVLKKSKGVERERLAALFTDLVFNILGAVEGTRNAVYYPIAELVTNIFEHSKRDSGFVFGQFYPKKNYLDICITDRGRGLAAAYFQEKKLKLSDEDAIIEVMKGNSTKSNNERGYGVRTSKRVVCEGLTGEFILVSGSAALVSANKKEKIVSMPDFYWQGVIVAYRIPNPSGSIDISPYLE